VGHKPAVLREMLAGRRVEMSVKVGTYVRAISGEVSPCDLELGLQLVYQLFATRPVASEGDMKLILQMTREAIAGQLEGPHGGVLDSGERAQLWEVPLLQGLHPQQPKRGGPTPCRPSHPLV